MTPWTVAHQAPLFMEFSRQEYRSRLPFPSLVYLPDPGVEPVSLALQVDSLPSEPTGKPEKRREPFLQDEEIHTYNTCMNLSSGSDG